MPGRWPSRSRRTTPTRRAGDRRLPPQFASTNAQFGFAVDHSEGSGLLSGSLTEPLSAMTVRPTGARHVGSGVGRRWRVHLHGDSAIGDGRVDAVGRGQDRGCENAAALHVIVVSAADGWRTSSRGVGASNAMVGVLSGSVTTPCNAIGCVATPDTSRPALTDGAMLGWRPRQGWCQSVRVHAVVAGQRRREHIGGAGHRRDERGGVAEEQFGLSTVHNEVGGLTGVGDLAVQRDRRAGVPGDVRARRER